MAEIQPEVEQISQIGGRPLVRSYAQSQLSMLRLAPGSQLSNPGRSFCRCPSNSELSDIFLPSPQSQPQPRLPEAAQAKTAATVTPEQALFTPYAPGASTHRLANPGAEALAIKIRCSNNDLYRVWPVFAVLPVGGEIALEVARAAGPPKEDKLVVQSLPCPAEIFQAALPGLFQADPEPAATVLALISADGLASAAVKVDPEQALFTPNIPGSSQHRLANPTGKPLAIKLKCSDNDLYRIWPVFAIIQAGGEIRLEVARAAGPAKEDKLVVQSLPCPGDTPEAALPGLFRAGHNPASVSLALVAADAAHEQTTEDQLTQLQRMIPPQP